MTNICGLCGEDYGRGLHSHLRSVHGIRYFALGPKETPEDGVFLECICGEKLPLSLSTKTGHWLHLYNHLSQSPGCWIALAMRGE